MYIGHLHLFETGDIFSDPELLVPGVADVTNLASAYEVVCLWQSM